MRNPLNEAIQWILRGRRGERSLVVDGDPNGEIHVSLSWLAGPEGTERIVEGLGPTLDDALIMALDQLPRS